MKNFRLLLTGLFALLGIVGPARAQEEWPSIFNPFRILTIHLQLDPQTWEDIKHDQNYYDPDLNIRVPRTHSPPPRSTPPAMAQSNLAEYTASTDPRNTASVLRIASLERSGPGIRITFDAISGKHYRIEYRADLAGGQWQSIYEQTAGASGVVEVIHAGAGSIPKGFYRLVLIP